jgi:hypothetical protein
MIIIDVRDDAYTYFYIGQIQHKSGNKNRLLRIIKDFSPFIFSSAGLFEKSFNTHYVRISFIKIK